jgi:hypothetical protein
MTSNNTPLTPEDEAHFVALCAELGHALGTNDRDQRQRVLDRIATEVHPDLARHFIEGLADVGFANLSARMGADDPKAYAVARDLIAEFGPRNNA